MVSMTSSAASGFTGVSIISLFLGLIVCFLPTIIAILKRNVNAKQVLIYQILLTVANIGFIIVIEILGFVLALPIVGTMFNIISIVWGLFMLVMWLYVLLNALRDTEMTLLKKFGINI